LFVTVKLKSRRKAKEAMKHNWWSRKKSPHWWKPVFSLSANIRKHWIPAFSGMTGYRNFWLFARTSRLINHSMRTYAIKPH